MTVEIKRVKNREELGAKYFQEEIGGDFNVYSKGNMGIITLLSDVQHGCEDANEILNDIKAILIADHNAEEK